MNWNVFYSQISRCKSQMNPGDSNNCGGIFCAPTLMRVKPVSALVVLLVGGLIVDMKYHFQVIALEKG